MSDIINSLLEKANNFKKEGKLKLVALYNTRDNLVLITNDGMVIRKITNMGSCVKAIYFDTSDYSVHTKIAPNEHFKNRFVLDYIDDIKSGICELKFSRKSIEDNWIEHFCKAHSKYFPDLIFTKENVARFLVSEDRICVINDYYAVRNLGINKTDTAYIRAVTKLYPLNVSINSISPSVHTDFLYYIFGFAP